MVNVFKHISLPLSAVTVMERFSSRNYWHVLLLITQYLPVTLKIMSHPSHDVGGISWFFSTCGTSVGFLTRYDGELREPLMWCRGQFRLTKSLMWLTSYCEACCLSVSNPVQKTQFRIWFQWDCFLKVAGSKQFCFFSAPIHLPCKCGWHVEVLSGR